MSSSEQMRSLELSPEPLCQWRPLLSAAAWRHQAGRPAGRNSLINAKWPSSFSTASSLPAPEVVFVLGNEAGHLSGLLRAEAHAPRAQWT